MPKQRCAWAEGHDLLRSYHDAEWGLPVSDDRRLFEMLNLEGAQAGLSWLTVMKKRDRYREVFADFDPARVARYTPAKRARLLLDPGIIRHAGKIDAVVTNARALLELRRGGESFAEVVWAFTDATAMSRDLKARGFRFVGPTICHAFMQATGMVNDHMPECFRRGPCERAADRHGRRRPTAGI